MYIHMVYLYSMAHTEETPVMEALVSSGEKPKKSRKKELQPKVETPQQKMEHMLISPEFAMLFEQAMIQLEEWNESAYIADSAHDDTRLGYYYDNIDYLRAVIAHMQDPKNKTRRAFTREDGFAHTRVVPDATNQASLKDQVAFEMFNPAVGLVNEPEQFYLQIARVPGGKTKDNMDAKSIFDLYLHVTDEGAALLMRTEKEPLRVHLEEASEGFAYEYVDPLLVYDYQPMPLHLEPEMLETVRGQMRAVYA